MRILALDFASVTGWAINADAGIVSGFWNIAPSRGESPGMRYIHLLSKLNEFLAAYSDLALVYYEQAHQRGGAPTEYAYGYSTHLQSWCCEHGIQHSALHTASLKKHATGKGNAKKDQMIAAAQAKWPEANLTDDNEVDARWLLDYALSQHT